MYKKFNITFLDFKKAQLLVFFLPVFFFFPVLVFLIVTWFYLIRNNRLITEIYMVILIMLVSFILANRVIDSDAIVYENYYYLIELSSFKYNSNEISIGIDYVFYFAMYFIKNLGFSFRFFLFFYSFSYFVALYRTFQNWSRILSLGPSWPYFAIALSLFLPTHLNTVTHLLRQNLSVVLMIYAISEYISKFRFRAIRFSLMSMFSHPTGIIMLLLSNSKLAISFLLSILVASYLDVSSLLITPQSQRLVLENGFQDIVFLSPMVRSLILVFIGFIALVYYKKLSVVGLFFIFIGCFTIIFANKGNLLEYRFAMIFWPYIIPLLFLNLRCDRSVFKILAVIFPFYLLYYEHTWNIWSMGSFQNLVFSNFLNLL